MDSEIDLIIKRHFGNSTSAACAAFDVTRQAISQWRRNGIPELRRYHLREFLGEIKPQPKRGRK